MKRRSFLAALAPIVALASPVVAQTQVAPAAVPEGTPKAKPAKPATGTTGTAGTAANGTAAAAPEAKTKRAKGPTEITSMEAMLDNKANLAVFSGVVDVKAPDYTVNCDKLTVYLKKSKPKAADAKVPEPGAIGADPVDKSDPAAKDKDKDGADQDGDGSGIDTAIAEGNVKILQIKPAVGNNPPEKYYGIGKKAVFDNNKQTCTLTGWPRVQQFVNGKLTREIVPLEEGCVIVMNNDRIDVRGGRQQTRILDEEALSGNDKPRSNTGATTLPGNITKPAGSPAAPGATAPATPSEPTFRGPTPGGLDLGPR